MRPGRILRQVAGIWLSVLLVVAASPGAAQDFTTFVAASDGIPLATDVYLSYGGGPWPVILIRTPYGKGSLWEVGEALALLGFSAVIQDTRGRFDSGGVDSVFRDDADDGRTTLQWITEQEWCDGRVGTFGGSAFAITQYLMAPGAGPALRSMMPVVATPDLYHHAFLQGGAIREALATNWLEGQDALHVYEEIREHRLKTSWWDPVEVLEYSDRVTAAGLHVGGWYDIFCQGSLDAFTTFQAEGGDGAVGRQYLIMGPWSHSSLGERDVGQLRFPSNARIDVLDLILPWFNHTLRGWPNEVQNWPPVQVYLMGAVGEPDAPGNRWVDLEEWPPRARVLHLYLRGDGGLVSEPAPAETMELTVDPANPVPTLGGNNLLPELVVEDRAMGDGPYDQRPIEDRPDVLTFTSEPLTSAVTVMGRLSATVWIVPDTPDLDIAVRLSDVYPDGRSMLVADGVQRARMRCGEEAECLLIPGVPTPITVDLWSTAIAFNRGHRIRVSISGSNYPRFEVNPNHGGDLDGIEPWRVARPQLLFGGSSASRVSLPVPVSSPRPGGQRRIPDGLEGDSLGPRAGSARRLR